MISSWEDSSLVPVSSLYLGETKLSINSNKKKKTPEVFYAIFFSGIFFSLILKQYIHYVHSMVFIS